MIVPAAPDAAKSGQPSEQKKQKAAGEVPACKQVPHRPSNAPALGLRAGTAATMVSQTQTPLEV